MDHLLNTLRDYISSTVAMAQDVKNELRITSMERDIAASAEKRQNAHREFSLFTPRGGRE